MIPHKLWSAKGKRGFEPWWWGSNILEAATACQEDSRWSVNLHNHWWFIPLSKKWSELGQTSSHLAKSGVMDYLQKVHEHQDGQKMSHGMMPEVQMAWACKILMIVNHCKDNWIWNPKWWCFIMKGLQCYMCYFIMGYVQQLAKHFLPRLTNFDKNSSLPSLQKSIKTRPCQSAMHGTRKKTRSKGASYRKCAQDSFRQRAWNSS